MTATLLFIVAAPSLALAHFDVVAYEDNGKIATGGHDDGTNEDIVSTRVFGYDFGEEPGDPYFIGDPGFNNGAFAIGVFPNNGLLPASKTLGFNVTTNLLYWDGTGSVAFAPAPAGVSLGLQRSSSTVHISGTGQTGTVPTISSTGASGRVHEHLGSLLQFSDDTNPAAPNAPDGIYVVGIELTLPDSGLANSDPIYLVYNALVDEEVHDEAMAYVEAQLVPEPASWLLACVGMGLVVIARSWRFVRVPCSRSA
jgi:hypothetical protein